RIVTFDRASGCGAGEGRRRLPESVHRLRGGGKSGLPAHRSRIPVRAGGYIRFEGAVGPRCIDRQHGEYAVPVLLSHEKWIATDHQIPAPRGMSTSVRLAIADRELP